MRDLGINIDDVPDEEEDVLKSAIQSCPLGRVPRTAVVGPNKKMTLTDSIDVMAEAIDNLGVGEAIDKIWGLTPTTRMTAVKEIVKDADVTT
ncbi:hypothetical protein AMTRI_Chr08g207120 [Amborella trichopoda]